MKKTLNSILDFGFGVVLGFLTNNLSEAFRFSQRTNWFLFVVVVLFFIIRIIRSHQRIIPTINITKIPKGKAASSQGINKKGLIVTISLPSPAVDLSQKIPVTSNLNTAMVAIKAHADSLEKIWLLGTADSEKAKGSASIFGDLIDYLKSDVSELGLKKNVEIIPLTPIPLDIDNQITKFVCQEVDKVFNDDVEPKHNLKPKDIIADCTGGYKSISLGVILACLEDSRDVQLVGTSYLENGRPNGDEAFPMVSTYTTNIKSHTS